VNDESDRKRAVDPGDQHVSLVGHDRINPDGSLPSMPWR
jgi:hypothetical protein